MHNTLPHILCAESGLLETAKGGGMIQFGEKFNCNNLDNSLHSTRVNRLSILKYKHIAYIVRCCMHMHTQTVNCILRGAQTHERTHAFCRGRELENSTVTGCSSGVVPSTPESCIQSRRLIRGELGGVLDSFWFFFSIFYSSSTALY